MKNLIYLFLSIFLIGSLDSCSQDVESTTGNEVLTGSYSRMLINGDFLYYVNTTDISTVDISNPMNPFTRSTIEVGFNIESLYRSNDLLFIGSSENMYIYQLEASGIPVFRTRVEYENLDDFRSCDPIVVKDDYAYVTLSSGNIEVSGCGTVRSINALLIFDISDLDNVIEIDRIQMDFPRGLGYDDDYLFVCEGSLGVDIFDIENPTSVEKLVELRGFKAFDLIPSENILMVIGDDLELFDYSDISNVVKMSTIDLNP